MTIKDSAAIPRLLLSAALVSAFTGLACGGGYAADISAGEGTVRTVDPVVENDWKFILSPYVWATSLTGNAAVLGIPADVNVPFNETFKNLKFAFMGEAELTNGSFGVYLNGQYANIGTGRSVYSIDINTGVTMTTLGSGVYYRLFQTRLGGETVSGTPRMFAVEPTVGLRWTQLTAKIEGAGHKLSGKESWIDPFIGSRASIDLTERWNLFMEGDVGGFGAGSKLSLNGQGYLGYRTTLLGHNSIIRAGYRALYQNYEDGGFKWDVTQHGPVLGVSMQF